MVDDASESLDLENGSEESEAALTARYDIKEYNNGWIATEDASVEFEEFSIFESPRVYNEKGVKFNYKSNTHYHKFEAQLNATKAYKGLTMKVKSDIKTDMVLSFQILHDVKIGQMNLNGVYLKYSVASLPTHWQVINANFSDENWKVNYNGTDYPLATVAAMIGLAGFQISSIGDLFPLCDVFQIKLRGQIGGGAMTYTCIDNFALLPVSPANEANDLLETFAALRPAYYVTTGLAMGTLEGTTLKLSVSGSPFTLQVATTITDNYQVEVKCTATGMDFDALFDTFDQAKTLELDTVSGSLRNYFEGGRAQAAKILDNFESYTETGTGYDGGHKTVANMTGLRKAYYGDYKSTPAQGYASLLDDNREGSSQRWTLMGGSYDQHNLTTDGGFMASKAMKIKAGGSWMRYICANLLETLQPAAGVAEAYERASYLAFIIKGTTNKQTARFRIHFANPVTPVNFATDRDEYDRQIAVEGSGWALYTVPLSPGRTYYGWSVALDNGNGNSGKYLTIDNVMLIY